MYMTAPRSGGIHLSDLLDETICWRSRYMTRRTALEWCSRIEQDARMIEQAAMAPPEMPPSPSDLWTIPELMDQLQFSFTGFNLLNP